MMDLKTARDELLMAENMREDSVYWSDGYWWEKMFYRLVEYESTQRNHLLQLVADSQNSEEAARYNQRLCRTLCESVTWYCDFRNSLERLLTSWEASNTIDALAQAQLQNHFNHIDQQIYAHQVWIQRLRLEYLELQSWFRGYVDANTWANTWQDLQAALQQQNAYYREFDNILPQQITEERLHWYHHMYATQQAISESGYLKRRPDRKHLQKSMRIIKKAADLLLAKM